MEDVIRDSELMGIIRSYLKNVRITEDPVEWFFSGKDIGHKICRLADHVFEYDLNASKGLVKRCFVNFYALGKREYDKERLL